MKYIKTFEMNRSWQADKTHDFYQIQIIHIDDNFQVDFFFKDSVIGSSVLNSFKQAKEYIINKLDSFNKSNFMSPECSEANFNVPPSPIYVIKIRDWSRDKHEPAFDVEIYWKEKYIGGTDGVFSITNKDKYGAFIAAKNYIKQKLITLPLNYDVIIKGNQFDL